MINDEFLRICHLCSALCVQIFKFFLKLEQSAKSHALLYCSTALTGTHMTTSSDSLICSVIKVSNNSKNGV